MIFQRLVDTLEIGGGLVHVRLLDLDEAQRVQGSSSMARVSASLRTTCLWTCDFRRQRR